MELTAILLDCELAREYMEEATELLRVAGDHPEGPELRREVYATFAAAEELHRAWERLWSRKLGAAA